MMKCEELETRIDQAARRFAETHDEKYKRSISRLSLQLADLRHLAVLEDALARCRDEDMRTTSVYAALEHFSKRVVVGWPIERFREALNTENEEGRWQSMNASRNGIRLAVNL